MPTSSTQALAFLNAALAKKDPEIIRPLKEYTYTRDLPIGNDLDRTVEALVLRSIVPVGQGTVEVGGRSWIGRGANDLKGVDYDMTASATRVYTGGREAKWTSLDIDRAAQTDGVQFDTEQVTIINDIFNAEADQIGYLGDSNAGFPGLLNSEQVTCVTGSGLMDGAVSDMSFDAVTSELTDIAIAAAEKTNDVVTPSVILVSPAVYAKLFSLKMSDINRTSALKWLETESIQVAKAGSCKVYSCKYLAGAGAGGKDRAVFYTPDARYLRYNVMPVWREKTYDKGLEYCAAYLWRIAELQFRYPETVYYVDGL